METTTGISTQALAALKLREEAEAMGKLSRLWKIAFAMHEDAMISGDVAALADASRIMEKADAARLALLERMSASVPAVK